MAGESIASKNITGKDDGRKAFANVGRKKKRGGFAFLKAALFILRSKPTKNPKLPLPLEVAQKGDWKTIVGWIRPLHLQDNPSPPGSPSPPQDHSVEANKSQPVSPPTPPNHNVATNVTPPPHHCRIATVENFEDVAAAPSSPSVASTSTGTMSQYASANNLRDLLGDDKDDDEDEEEEGDEDEVLEHQPADAMIDTKAEEFIARFYAQMRIQQHNGHGIARGQLHY